MQLDSHLTGYSTGRLDDEEALLNLISNTLAGRSRELTHGDTARVPRPATRRRIVVVEEDSPDLVRSAIERFPSITPPPVNRRHSLPVERIYPPSSFVAHSTDLFELDPYFDSLATRDSPFVETAPEPSHYLHQSLNTRHSRSLTSTQRIHPPRTLETHTPHPIGVSSGPMDDLSAALSRFTTLVTSTQSAASPREFQQNHPHIVHRTPAPTAGSHSTPVVRPNNRTEPPIAHIDSFTASLQRPRNDTPPNAPRQDPHIPTLHQRTRPPSIPHASPTHDHLSLDREAQPPTQTDDRPTAQGHVSALREVFEAKLREQRRLSRGGAAEGRRRRVRAPSSPPVLGCGQFGEGLGFAGEEAGLAQVGGHSSYSGPADGQLLAGEGGSALRRAATPRFGSRRSPRCGSGGPLQTEKLHSWASMGEEIGGLPSLDGLMRRGAEGECANAPASQVPDAAVSSAGTKVPTRRSRQHLATEGDPSARHREASSNAGENRPPATTTLAAELGSVTSPSIVLSPPGPEDLGELYASLYATGMFDSGAPAAPSVASHATDLALPRGQARNAPQNTTNASRTLFPPKQPAHAGTSTPFSAYASLTTHTDFFAPSSASDGPRSAPAGSPRVILSPARVSGSATPSDFGEWRRVGGGVYDGATRVVDDRGLELGSVGGQDPGADAEERDALQFEAASGRSEDQGDVENLVGSGCRLPLVSAVGCLENVA